ncbi:hypothetical protein NDU88_005516 [Pleurodeles waltl]|uniref:Uncharacterized protein n=1 Tax=Pleurodeles waltl TaxID=8319 RepID=A0AAV7NN03_PLEWA|nr:hypothetical protein NDU88_005516 [Pleurodeles waltl]
MSQPPVGEKVPGVAACTTHSMPHLQQHTVPRCHHRCPVDVTNSYLQPLTRRVGPAAKRRGWPLHVAPQPSWHRATSTSTVASAAPELVGLRGSHSPRLWSHLAPRHQRFPRSLRGFLAVSLPPARQQGGKAARWGGSPCWELQFATFVDALDITSASPVASAGPWEFLCPQQDGKEGKHPPVWSCNSPCSWTLPPSTTSASHLPSSLLNAA